MSIFIGGPLDGTENYEVPPPVERFGLLRVPYRDYFPSHPLFGEGYYEYVFDGLAWRFQRMVRHLR